MYRGFVLASEDLGSTPGLGPFAVCHFPPSLILFPVTYSAIKGQKKYFKLSIRFRLICKIKLFFCQSTDHLLSNRYSTTQKSQFGDVITMKHVFFPDPHQDTGSWLQVTALCRAGGLYPPHPFVVHCVILLWFKRDVPVGQAETHSRKHKGSTCTSSLWWYWRVWTTVLRPEVIWQDTGSELPPCDLLGRPFLSPASAAGALCVCVRGFCQRGVRMK